MPSPAEFEIKTDALPDLVRVCYRGHVTVAATQACCTELVGLLPRLRPGFAVLTDLSCLDSMDLECAGPLAKLMDAYRAGGVGMVVRVIPDRHKDIGFNILSIIHYREHVRIVTCDTLAEAERVLAPSSPTPTATK